MDQKQALVRIIDYLNQKTGSSFRPAAAASKRAISARLNEGFTVPDFRDVIDEKSRQWIGNETMERYLRPQTLFGNKFESYLQEARRHGSKPGKASAGAFKKSAKELLE